MAADSDVSYLTTMTLFQQYDPMLINDWSDNNVFSSQPETEVFEITDFTTASEWERCCEERAS